MKLTALILATAMVATGANAAQIIYDCSFHTGIIGGDQGKDFARIHRKIFIDERYGTHTTLTEFTITYDTVTNDAFYKDVFVWELEPNVGTHMVGFTGLSEGGGGILISIRPNGEAVYSRHLAPYDDYTSFIQQYGRCERTESK